MTKRDTAALRVNRETVRELTEDLGTASGGGTTSGNCSISYLVGTCGVCPPHAIDLSAKLGCA
ncbi:MAG TPA: hypothetical protein VG245_01365 [Candidatus Dormibacteraeota bacterium]|jgi:hypothetical protein|nr:hypothetical protein [Candidatus Dormibacteraeota bacterium]